MTSQRLKLRVYDASARASDFTLTTVSTSLQQYLSYVALSRDIAEQHAPPFSGKSVVPGSISYLAKPDLTPSHTSAGNMVVFADLAHFEEVRNKANETGVAITFGVKVSVGGAAHVPQPVGKKAEVPKPAAKSGKTTATAGQGPKITYSALGVPHISFH